MTLHRLSAALWVLSLAARCFGAEAADSFPWVDPSGVAAAVVFAGEDLPGSVRENVSAWAGGKGARIVVIAATDGATDGMLVNSPEMAPAVIVAGPLDE